MNKVLISTGLFASLIGISQLSEVEAATPLPGAIFTTNADGTIVNANQYASKCDVYLNGGPGVHAPAGAAGLPAGDYFFQVTDPSGQTLLSTDVVNNRQFTISTDGVITAYTGTGVHPIGTSQVHPELGTKTISLANNTCPTDYLDTPNNGGVYKAWVTPVASFVGDPTKVDNACGNGCFHGFAASMSKTDNFKVQPAIPNFTLSITTLFVDSSVTSPATSPATSVMITVTDSTGATNTFYTSSTDGTLSIGGLVSGSYTVTESVPSGYQVTGLGVNGATPLQSPYAQPVYSFTWTAGQAAPSLVFDNQLIPLLPF